MVFPLCRNLRPAKLAKLKNLLLLYNYLNLSNNINMPKFEKKSDLVIEKSGINSRS